MRLTLLNLIVKFLLVCRFPAHVSIAVLTEKRYSSATLEKFRTLEGLSVKATKCQLDLDFLTRCKDADLMPTFLQFKLSSNRLRSSAEVIKCRRRLLVKEINNKRRSLEQLKGRISVAKTEFRSIVYNLDWVHYQRVIDEKCSTVCSTSSDRLQNIYIEKCKIINKLSSKTI